MPLLINILSAFMCLGFSAMFHLCYVKSPKFLDVLSRMDYGGISLLIFGSAFPITYYSFASKPAFVQRYLYIGLAGLLCSACFATSLIKKFDSGAWRPVRGIMFMLAGLSFIGVLIQIRVPASPDKLPTSALWYGLGGAVYILGAMIYIARVPERCNPGHFDLCGASHQIFHCAVLVGCTMHFTQNYFLFNQRSLHECPILPN